MKSSKQILMNDIVRTIAYFDIFNYPLTDKQVYNFLPRNSVTQEDISLLLEEMVRANIIARTDDYFCLISSKENIGSDRKENEKRAKQFTSYAKVVTHLLKRFPFVRAVFITGSLSKNVASKESDIDLMIVTAKHRLWICKTMLSLFRKVFLLGSHKYFCTNYYISENNYLHLDRNVFSAIELATTKAAWNTSAFREYLKVNSWVSDFLPNNTDNMDATFVVKENRSLVQRALEKILSVFPLTRIDSVLMNYYRRHWSKRYYYLSAEKRELLFRTTPDVSSVWKNDQQESILNRYYKKTFELGLQ